MLTNSLRESADAVRITANDAQSFLERLGITMNDNLDALELARLRDEASATMAAVRQSARAVDDAAEEVRSRVAHVGILAGLLLSYIIVDHIWKTWRS